MKFSVVIPYHNDGSKWEHDGELRYMLRSIDENFDFDYDVTIFARKNIPWIQNAKVLNIERYYPPHIMEKMKWKKPHYENFFDTINKIKLASQMDDLQENILYTYDDVILLKKQSEEQIRTVYGSSKLTDKNIHFWMNPGKNKWKNTIFQAIDRAKGFGQVYLYETHLPRYFTKSNLRQMFKIFPIDKVDIPYAPSTLYYNMFYDKPDYLYMESDEAVDNKIKAGFYQQDYHLCDSFSSLDMESVEKAVKDKIWLNYNDRGLTEHLKKWIYTRFTKKSRFEK